jgi:hypothetical protein
MCSKKSPAWSSSEFTWTVAQPLKRKIQMERVGKRIKRFFIEKIFITAFLLKAFQQIKPGL